MQRVNRRETLAKIGIRYFGKEHSAPMRSQDAVSGKDSPRGQSPRSSAMDSAGRLHYQRAMFRRLYDWTLSLAQSPRAPVALAAVAFAESSFFPIPPDVLLVPMALAKPKRAWHYATICTIASVLGGLLGYAIGYLLYDTVGKWLIGLYGYGQKVDALRAFYAEWGALFILIKGVTPIPYKLVTIVSGLLEYNLLLFIVLSVITRGARFFLVAALLNRFGDQARAMLDRHFGVFIVIIVAFIVLGFWLAARLV
jgi:membrane protein YqaA with SNARE-associated domain